MNLKNIAWSAFALLLPAQSVVGMPRKWKAYCRNCRCGKRVIVGSPRGHTPGPHAPTTTMHGAAGVCLARCEVPTLQNDSVRPLRDIATPVWVRVWTLSILSVTLSVENLEMSDQRTVP